MAGLGPGVGEELTRGLDKIVGDYVSSGRSSYFYPERNCVMDDEIGKPPLKKYGYLFLYMI